MLSFLIGSIGYAVYELGYDVYKLIEYITNIL